MGAAGETDRYTAGAIILHWMMALLIIGQIAGGLYMTSLPDSAASQKFQLFQTHKSFGITILFLSFVRLGWRLTHRAPALPDGMAGWERLGARASHTLFYVLMIGIPLGGWAVVSASPFAASVPTLLFGVIPWPHLPFFDGVDDKQGVYETLAGMHEAGAFAMLGLLFVHIAAALKHQFVNKDGVLGRMLPFLR